MVEGLQGAPGADNRIQTGHVAASVKHFLGDGGTSDGIDQGNTQVPESELIAIQRGLSQCHPRRGDDRDGSSFNSWNGQKMHGNRSLLTDVLKQRMGFTGFVVGDWNGHAQVPGCAKDDCPASFNAGLDMAMAPDGWKGLFDNTVREVRAGQIPMARVDDAVRRILRVKFRLGLFDPARPLADDARVMGSPNTAPLRAKRCASRWCCSRTMACCRCAPNPRAGGGAGGRRYRPAIGRLDAELAGRRQYQRRFPPCAVDLCRAGRSGAGRRRHRRSARTDASRKSPTWPWWCLARRPMPKAWAM
jgi:hypothetical protein